jgi:uncharacterized RDD family membrane protein YckC/DNA-directed RNA polymerase subunit RPC12/RpoP
MSQEAPVETVFSCSQCGRTFAHSNLVQIAGNWVCAECKPAFLSRVMASGAAVTSKWHYAGFWIRVVARLIDGIALGIAQAFIALLFFGTFGAQFLPSVTRSAPIGLRMSFQFLSYAIAIAYETVLLRYQGATLGKMALGLKVVRSNGESLGWGVSVGRYFMYIVSGIILLIGYIMAGFDNEKRALHDRVCDTRVIYKRSLA